MNEQMNKQVRNHLISSDILPLLPCSICLKLGLPYTQERLHKGVNSRTGQSLGAILEATYHTYNINFDHLVKTVSKLTIVMNK